MQGCFTGFGFRVLGLGFKFWGLGSGIQGLGFRVRGLVTWVLRESKCFPK